MRVLICALFFIIKAEFALSQTDDTVRENAFGQDVVEATIRKITDTGIFQNDHYFLLRLAFLESEFGATHNSSGTFQGGIWSVDESLFRETSDSSLNSHHLAIKNLLGVDWAGVTWGDLQKPFYSGLAAALYFTRVNEEIPLRITHQAEHWRKWYRPLGDVQRFIEESEKLRNQSKCEGRMDLCIVLDSSGSINQGDPRNYGRAKEFVAQLIESFTLEESRIGMLLYSDNYRDIFPLNNTFSIAQMATLARDAVYLNMGTRTDLGIFRSVQMFQDAGTREGIPKLMFVLTDGNSDRGSNVIGAVEAARAEAVKSVAIGIGSYIDADELTLIAMNETKNVFVTDDFEALQDILHEVANLACETAATVSSKEYLSKTIRENTRHLYAVQVPDTGIFFRMIGGQNTTLYWSRTNRVPSKVLNDGTTSGSVDSPGWLYISVESEVTTNYTLYITEDNPTNPPPTTPPMSTSTSPPCNCNDNPTFTKAIYRSTMPSWPAAGTTARLGIQAYASDGSPLSYEIISSEFDFIELTPENDIIFTADIVDGAFVGPNNVMLFEVQASVTGNKERVSSAAVAIVFPKGTKVSDETV